jgi:hypothetical protein
MLVHVHSWIWSILPPGASRVHVVGDPELGAVLRAAGLDLVDADANPDAVLICRIQEAAGTLARGALSAPLIAVAVPPWPARDPGHHLAPRLLRRAPARLRSS